MTKKEKKERQKDKDEEKDEGKEGRTVKRMLCKSGKMQILILYVICKRIF